MTLDKQPKTFVIALKDHPVSLEQLEDCRRSADQHGWTLETFWGVNGTKIVHEDWTRIGVKPMTKKIGQRGCWFSHFLMWNKCVELDEPIVVLEHDAIIERPWEPLNIKKSLVKLHRLYKKNLGFHPVTGRWSNSTHAYCLLPEHAAKLINAAKRIGCYNADVFLGNNIIDVQLLGEPELVSRQNTFSTTETIHIKKTKGIKKMIYVTGCSHTAGTIHSMPNKKDIYPERLKSEYGYEVEYYAKAGSSNDRIFRQAIENTVNRMIDGYTVPWEAVVVQWTSVDRFETPTYPSDGEMIRRFIQFNGIQPVPGDTMDHRPWSGVARSKDINVEFVDFYKSSYDDIDHWNNPNEYTQDEVAKIHSVIKNLEKKLLTQVISLDRFMKYNGVDRVIHMFCDPFLKHTIGNSKLYEYMVSRCEILTHPMIGLIQLLEYANYKKCQVIIDPDINNFIDGHFMADAHLRITDWIHDVLSGRINKPLQGIHVRDPDFLLGKEDELEVDLENNSVQIFDYDV